MRASEFFSISEGKKYLSTFKDEIFIIKYGGAALEEADMMDYFLEDVAAMAQHSIKMVIIHGGGKALSKKMKDQNIEVQFEDGMRVTSEKTVTLAKEVFTELNETICNKLKLFGADPISLTNGDTVRAKLIDSKKINNRVGIVHSIDAHKFDLSRLPVLSSIGRSVGEPEDTIQEGSLLNINADLVAVAVAKALKARKIVFISDVNGIYLDPKDSKTQLSHVTKQEIQELIDKKILQGGMKLKVEMALDALASGVNKVHFIDGRIDHSLIKEIFTDEGIGTEIVH